MVKTDGAARHVAAISCGIYKGTPVLDLDYAEDSTAETDANFVMTGDGRHRRGAGHGREGAPFTQDELNALMGWPQGHPPAGRSAEDGGGLMESAGHGRAN
jgi:ribonuclease PH